MIEWLLETVGEFIGDLLEGGAEVVVDAVEGLSDLGISEVLSTGILVYGAITVASLTVSSIRSELMKRQELKAKGVTSAVITDFIEQNGHTEITLAALNAQNKQVGTVKMQSRTSSGIKKGTKISLT